MVLYLTIEKNAFVDGLQPEFFCSSFHLLSPVLVKWALVAAYYAIDLSVQGKWQREITSLTFFF